MARKKKWVKPCIPGLLRVKHGDRYCVLTLVRNSPRTTTRIVSCHKTRAAAEAKMVSIPSTAKRRKWVARGASMKHFRKMRNACVAKGKAKR